MHCCPLSARHVLAALLTVSTLAAAASAQNVRFSRENGVDFMETTTQVRTPVATTRTTPQQRTVYKEELNTKVHESTHTVYQPVVEYVWEPRVHGVLNPFRPNTVQYHLVPRTRWEPRQQTVRTPITYRTVTPHTQTVHVPQRELGFANTTQTQRTALTPDGGGAGARFATRPGDEHHHVAPTGEIGGVGQLEGDHPRHGDATLNR